MNKLNSNGFPICNTTLFLDYRQVVTDNDQTEIKAYIRELKRRDLIESPEDADYDE